MRPVNTLLSSHSKSPGAIERGSVFVIGMSGFTWTILEAVERNFISSDMMLNSCPASLLSNLWFHEHRARTPLSGREQAYLLDRVLQLSDTVHFGELLL